MENALDALPAETSELIKRELANVNPELLEQFNSGQAPTNDQRAAVNEILARVVIRSMGSDWVPNAHGLAAERAVKAFLEKWPLNE